MSGEMPRPVVVAVGLGPADAGQTTAAALAVLESGAPLYLRTARHPAAEPWLARGAVALDRHYEAAASFADTYQAIVDELVDAATANGRVVYAVPGSPFVLEETVARLAAEPAIALEVVPGMSFLDLAWARLRVDPVRAAVRLVDAQDFARQAAGSAGPLLVAHLWSRTLCSEVKLSVEEFPAEEVVILHHLGLPDEAVFSLAWSELDRAFEPDHLTCAYVPRLAAPVGAELVALDELAHTLREACPWDAEQSHASLARHLIEEAYEAVEAIDELGEDPEQAAPEVVAHLEEELGDVLFQVYAHTVLAAEEGLFSLADVARTVHDKLVGRHPHVFAVGDGEAPTTSGAQEARWEQLKQKEKGRESLLEGVPVALPALARAAKLEGRARAAGLAVTTSAPELPARQAARRQRLAALLADIDDETSAEAAFGAVLLDLARFAADRRVEPEQALRRAVVTWEQAIRAAEAAAAASGSSLAELAAPARRSCWFEAGAG